MSAPRASKPHPTGSRIEDGGSGRADSDRAPRPVAYALGPNEGDGDNAPCVWMTAGLVAYKLCDRSYDCEHCLLDRALGGRSERGPDELRRAHLEFRGDRGYSASHAWARPSDGSRVRCGVDALAARLLDRVTAVVLPARGTHVQQGRPACWLVDESEPIPFDAPLSGTVAATNVRVQDDPSLVGSAPYDEGWLIEIESDPALPHPRPLQGVAEIRRRSAQALRLLRRRRARANVCGRAAVGPTLLDGGGPLLDLRRVLGTARYHRLLRRILR